MTNAVIIAAIERTAMNQICTAWRWLYQPPERAAYLPNSVASVCMSSCLFKPSNAKITMVADQKYVSLFDVDCLRMERIWAVSAAFPQNKAVMK